MLAKRILACLDVQNGRVVKGVKFQDLADRGDPATLAERYAEQGADEIIFLDVGATVEGRDTLVETVRATAERLFVPLTVGGGVRSVADARRLLRAGADKVAVNSAALADPALLGAIGDDYGRQCVVAAIDAKRTPAGTWEVYTHGGRRPTGKDAVEWAKQAAEAGAGEILLTSIDADGTRDGYDLALTSAVACAVSVPVVASGGCGRAEHVVRAFREGMADAALVAGLFHDGIETPQSLKRKIAGSVVVRA